MFDCLSVFVFICLFACLFVCSFVCSFGRLFVRSFVFYLIVVWLNDGWFGGCAWLWLVGL